MIDIHKKYENPKGWSLVTLKEIGNVITGNTPKKSNKEYYGKDYNFYKPTDLNYGYNVKESKDKLSNIGIKKARLLPIKSILVTCIGATIGKTGFNRIEGATNQQINAIVPYVGILPEYIYSICISPQFQKQIIDNSSSTTLQILNKSKFESLLIPIPPLNEQKRIVEKIEELFTKLDAFDENLKITQSKLDIYRKSVLANAFYGDEKTLPMIVSSDKHSIKRGPFGGSLKKSIFVSKGYKVYEQQHAIKNDFDRGRYYISPQKYKEMESFSVKPGDFIISCSGTIGKIAEVPNNAQEGIINQALLKIRLDDDKIINKYFKYLFESELIQRHLKKISRGVAIKNVPSVKKLKEIKFPVPPLNEQKIIVERIEEHLSIINKVEETINDALIKKERLKTSILKNAFSGKLVPQDPNDEPAEVLLKRIKQEHMRLT